MASIKNSSVLGRYVVCLCNGILRSREHRGMRGVSVNVDDSPKHKIERKTQLQITYGGMIHASEIMWMHMLCGNGRALLGVMSPAFRMVVPTWEERGM